ncbi:MAG: glycoside hydrolase family 97 N-terminal domain-containing protein, partial [Bacteroidota bacterium]
MNLSLKSTLLLLIALCPFFAVAQTITSPDKNFSMQFALKDGVPTYQLTYKNKPVIKQSTLGVEVKNAASFIDGFTITNTAQASVNDTWEPIMGEQKTIRNNYNELAVTLSQSKNNNRYIIIRFRLFNDGLGFRYEFPKQDGLSYFIIKEEHTEFKLAGDHKIFWIPGDYDTNEYAYTTSKISEIPALQKKATIEINAQRPIENPSVQTPSMMKSPDGLYINIHEAGLINYPAMQLNVDAATLTMSSHLTPDAVGNKGYMQTPQSSPWRTIVVSDKATDILASKLILNLNEPTKYKDVSFIKPVKYIGVWWEYFVAGRSTWAYGKE